MACRIILYDRRRRCSGCHPFFRLYYVHVHTLLCFAYAAIPFVGSDCHADSFQNRSKFRARVQRHGVLSDGDPAAVPVRGHGLREAGDGSARVALGLHLRPLDDVVSVQHCRVRVGHAAREEFGGILRF